MRFRIAMLPDKLTWPRIAGAASLCGIGFTMSLFFGEFAFADEAQIGGGSRLSRRVDCHRRLWATSCCVLPRERLQWTRNCGDRSAVVH
ncbi:MAG: Na+/H+ antiporter NhaA [Parvularculaceae bacterium]